LSLAEWQLLAYQGGTHHSAHDSLRFPQDTVLTELKPCHPTAGGLYLAASGLTALYGKLQRLAAARHGSHHQAWVFAHLLLGLTAVKRETAM
jgi:hypothetical protein